MLMSECYELMNCLQSYQRSCRVPFLVFPCPTLIKRRKSSFTTFLYSQKQLVELTSTLEEERIRARRLQNERDVQQATAMSYKERERHLQTDLENEKKKRAQLEQKLGNEREKNADLNRDLTERDKKLGELQQDLDSQALKQSEKVCWFKEILM